MTELINLREVKEAPILESKHYIVVRGDHVDALVRAVRACRAVWNYLGSDPDAISDAEWAAASRALDRFTDEEPTKEKK